MPARLGVSGILERRRTWRMNSARRCGIGDVTLTRASYPWLRRSSGLCVHRASRWCSLIRLTAPDPVPPGTAPPYYATWSDGGVSCRVLLPLVDQEAVRSAHQAGAGATLRLSLGGKLDKLFGQPIHLDVEVERVGEASFRFKGPAFHGLEVHMGPVAVLRVGDIHILVSERPVWTVDPALHRAVGLEPTQAQIVVVRSPNMFRAAYEPIAHAIMVVDTPGLASSNFGSLPFTRLPRPFYPLDEHWPGAPWA
jgi:hypothetical protein